MALQPLPTLIAHRMPGRARLRVEARADESAVVHLGRSLAEHPSVREARANERSRSVLILHEGDLAPILADAVARGLIVLNAPASSTPMRRVKRAIEQLDERIQDQTQHSVGLGGVAFVALAAAGVWQALNGRLLPAGTTLFNYALGVMQWGAEREQPTSDPESNGSHHSDVAL